jgi:hypothetical protein
MANAQLPVNAQPSIRDDSRTPTAVRHEFGTAKWCPTSAESGLGRPLAVGNRRQERAERRSSVIEHCEVAVAQACLDL